MKHPASWRLARTLAAVLLAVGSISCVRRYLTVDYDRPTARLRASVSIARVSDEPLSVVAPVHLIVNVQPPSDSVVALVLQAPIRYADIHASPDSVAGAVANAYSSNKSHDKESGFNSADGDYASAVISLKDAATNVDILVDSIRPCRVIHIPTCEPIEHPPVLLSFVPGQDTSLHLLVFMPQDRRLERVSYHLRLQWVSFPVLRRSTVVAQGTARADAPEPQPVKRDATGADQATVHELLADTHFTRVNYFAVPWIAVGAIALVLLTVSSR